MLDRGCLIHRHPDLSPCRMSNQLSNSQTSAGLDQRVHTRDEGVDSPTELDKPPWLGVLRRSLRGFKTDKAGVVARRGQRSATRDTSRRSCLPIPRLVPSATGNRHKRCLPGPLRAWSAQS